MMKRLTTLVCAVSLSALSVCAPSSKQAAASRPPTLEEERASMMANRARVQDEMQAERMTMRFEMQDGRARFSHPSLSSVGGYAAVLPPGRARTLFDEGMGHYRRFDGIKLDAGNPQELGWRVGDKRRALEDAAGLFGQVMDGGAAGWFTVSAYMAGRGYSEMVDALAGQPLFGSGDQLIAAKIQMLSSLGPHIDKAMEFFDRNIAYAKEHGLSDEYVEASKQAFMELAFMKGWILEEVGLVFKTAPLPLSRGLTEQEREFYQGDLDKQYRNFLKAAVPLYEAGLRRASEFGIDGPWLEAIRERLGEIR